MNQPQVQARPPSQPMGPHGTIVLGEVRISVLEVPPGGIPLRRNCAAATSVEFVFAIDDAVIVRDAGRSENLLLADEAIYLVGSRQYSVHSRGPSRIVTAGIPTAAIDQYIGSAETSAVLTKSPVMNPMKKFLIGVMEGEADMDRLSAYFMEKLVLEMVVSLVLESRGAADLAVPSLGLLDRAMAHISAYKTDRGLSPLGLAQKLNISTRQLQRLFSTIGSTPSREIRRQRAELAMSMLSNPSYRVLTVSQVAHHSGFADASELRRAFDALGYSTPTQTRTRELQPT